MRICLYAGPGVGKSTIAAYVFSHLKIKNIDIEHVTEYIKTWAYEKRKLQGCDQFYVFAKQWRREDTILRSGVQHIITDSPLLMQCSYAIKYGAEGATDILNRALEIEKKNDSGYTSLNILLQRKHGVYQEVGRYQKESEAIEMDKYIENFLDECGVKYHVLPNDCETVAKFCESQIIGE